jgi:hypothetical protein
VYKEQHQRKNGQYKPTALHYVPRSCDSHAPRGGAGRKHGDGERERDRERETERETEREREERERRERELERERDIYILYKYVYRGHLAESSLSLTAMLPRDSQKQLHLFHLFKFYCSWKQKNCRCDEAVSEKGACATNYGKVSKFIDKYKYSIL